MKFLAQILSIVSLLTLNPLSIHATDTSDAFLSGTPDNDTWALDIGFGNQPYMRDVVSLGLVTPYLFEGSYEANWRLSFNFTVKDLLANDNKSIANLALYFENDSKIYKDIVTSYTKFGVGVLLLDKYYYDEVVYTLPIALGLQIVALNTENTVLSYFFEYNTSIFDTYDEAKSIPSATHLKMDNKVFLSSTTTMGVRFTF